MAAADVLPVTLLLPCHCTLGHCDTTEHLFFCFPCIAHPFGCIYEHCLQGLVTSNWPHPALSYTAVVIDIDPPC